MTRQVQTIDETGWTHVSSRNSKRKPLRRRRLSLRSSSPPPPLPPHDELLARLNRIRSKVRELDVLRSAVERLASVSCENAVTPPSEDAGMDGGASVVELLLLGLGRVELEVGIWQLAFALEVMEFDSVPADSENNHKRRKRVLKAYDPVWSTEEIEFINSIPGVEVVDLLQTPDPATQAREQCSADGPSLDQREPLMSSRRGRDAPIILLAPHLELDILSLTFASLGHRIMAAMCNDLRMSGLEKEIETRGWTEEVLKEVKEAAQGRSFNHMAVYIPPTRKMEE